LRRQDVFTAGADEGNFLVTARAGSAAATVSVRVSVPGHGKEVVEHHEVSKDAKITKATSVSWVGQVPKDKWMTFYTKVLAKFASGMGLKVTVHIEATSESDIPAQKIEDARVALRELGLDDRLQTK